jgi:hypothetical protein
MLTSLKLRRCKALWSKKDRGSCARSPSSPSDPASRQTAVTTDILNSHNTLQTPENVFAYSPAITKAGM